MTNGVTAALRTRLPALVLLPFCLCAATGCTVAGYATGAYLDAHFRESVSPDERSSLARNQRVWLTLADGDVFAGAVVTRAGPDSVTIAGYSSEAAPSAFDAPPRHTFAWGSVERVEVLTTSYRMAGLVVGATTDVVLLLLLGAGSETTFKPAKASAR
jgi:hypothetical protein